MEIDLPPKHRVGEEILPTNKRFKAVSTAPEKRSLGYLDFNPKRLRIAVQENVLESRINACRSLEELKAVYEALESESLLEVFTVKHDLLTIETEAKASLSKGEFTKATELFLSCLQVEFTNEVFDLLCQCLFAQKKSPQVSYYYQQLLLAEDLPQLNKFRAWLHVGEYEKCLDHAELGPLACELRDILAAFPPTPSGIKRGMEIAPESSELLDLYLKCCLGAISQEFRESKLSQNEFGLELFDRMDFAHALYFTNSTADRVLISKLTLVLLHPDQVDWSSMETELAPILQTRLRFHSKWLLCKYRAFGDSNVALLQRAVELDSANLEARQAWADHLVSLKQFEQAKRLLMGFVQHEELVFRVPAPSTAYEVLNLPSSATLQQVRKSFKTLALQFHPDKNPSFLVKAYFLRISTAYQLIGTAESKLVYDNGTRQLI
ncbi:hypothetical protein BASA81_005861 [Batrachochytrium salamandrivorans]|nr:hypothetical protein BASA81_005861 [Batrachochytrium salamandrivorans]